MTDHGTQLIYRQAIEAWLKMEKENKIRRFRELNPFARKGQIVFAGSSLMEQFPINEFLMNNALPLTIYNRGIGGYTTEELIAHIDTCILDLEPKLIFLNIGTNDLNADDYRLDILMQQYETIIQKIRQTLPETTLCLMAFYPVNQKVFPDPETSAAFGHRTNERIQEANRSIKAIAEKWRIPYLDFNEGITDSEGNLKKEYTVEGVHMHMAGYHAIFEKMLPFLQTNDMKAHS